MPQALLVLVGAVGAVIAAKFIAREWRRVNDELEGARRAPVETAREAVPVLRRDPATGEYRP